MGRGESGGPGALSSRGRPARALDAPTGTLGNTIGFQAVQPVPAARLARGFAAGGSGRHGRGLGLVSRVPADPPPRQFPRHALQANGRSSLAHRASQSAGRMVRRPADDRRANCARPSTTCSRARRSPLRNRTRSRPSIFRPSRNSTRGSSSRPDASRVAHALASRGGAAWLGAVVTPEQIQGDLVGVERLAARAGAEPAGAPAAGRRTGWRTTTLPPDRRPAPDPDVTVVRALSIRARRPGECPRPLARVPRPLARIDGRSLRTGQPRGIPRESGSGKWRTTTRS